MPLLLPLLLLLFHFSFLSSTTIFESNEDLYDQRRSSFVSLSNHFSRTLKAVGLPFRLRKEEREELDQRLEEIYECLLKCKRKKEEKEEEEGRRKSTMKGIG